MAHQRLCDLVPGDGGHGVDHGPVPADGDIGGARANVRQYQVQQPQVRGDYRVESGNWLQRQAGDLQPRRLHDGVQALHHFAGQEGCHHIRLQLLAVVVLQGGQGVAVEQVAGDRIAYQVEPPLALPALVELGLRVGDRTALQLADEVAVDAADLGQVHGVMPLFRAQRTAGGGHAYPGQLAAQLLLHPLRHTPGHPRYQIDILNLAVQHGPLAVLLLFNGQDLQTVVHHAARHADDAAGADIQREHQLCILFLPFLAHGLLSPSFSYGCVLSGQRIAGAACAVPAASLPCAPLSVPCPATDIWHPGLPGRHIPCWLQLSTSCCRRGCHSCRPRSARRWDLPPQRNRPSCYPRCRC